MNDEKHREARRRVHDMYKNYKKSKDLNSFTSDPELRNAVEMVRADFDQLGILLIRGSILKKAVLDAYGQTGFQCWEMLKDHIKDERSNRKFDEYMRNFETFAKEAYNHWWKQEGVILKGPP